MSLLLEARKKLELALAQTGVHRAIEPQLSESLRLEDAPAATQQTAPAKGASDPRTAGKNLFAAKASHTGGMRLGIVPIALIIGLVLAAGGGFYVWREITPPATMMAVRQTPPPPPAAQIANTTPPAVAQASPAPATPASVAPADARSTSLAAAPAGGKHATAGVNLKQSVHAPKVAIPSAPGAQHSTEAKPVLIEHVREDGAVDPDLLAAYQAYRNGDLATAWQRYGEVLSKDARNRNTPNRDALLGMAAIAQLQAQDATAARYYDQVLALDPRDPVANAGMLALSGKNDAASTESRLKLLLAQQSRSDGTQSTALYFALGNLYAEQARWSDAQQAYFNAYNLEQGNAQIAFNLAISLDHLGQGKLAAQHYRRALQLGLADNAGFNRAQAQRRVNELSAP